MIRLLVSQGAKVDNSSSTLLRIMHCFYCESCKIPDQGSCRRRVDMVRMLLEAGSEFNLNTGSKYYYRAYYAYCRKQSGLIETNHAPSSLTQQVYEECWEDSAKLLFGPGPGASDIDNFPYRSVIELVLYTPAFNQWLLPLDAAHMRRLQVLLDLGARLDISCTVGDRSLQNFIASIPPRRCIQEKRQHEAYPKLPILQRFVWLLQHGANPLALDLHNRTATWLAFHLGFLSEWTDALAQCGISIAFVARHALSTISQDLLNNARESKWESPYFYMINYPDSDESGYTNYFLYHGITTVEEARTAIIEAFAKIGCSIECSDDELNEYSLSATGVDFTPATIYRGKTVDLSRRKPRTAEEA